MYTAGRRMIRTRLDDNVDVPPAQVLLLVMSLSNLVGYSNGAYRLVFLGPASKIIQVTRYTYVISHMLCRGKRACMITHSLCASLSHVSCAGQLPEPSAGSPTPTPPLTSDGGAVFPLHVNPRKKGASLDEGLRRLCLVIAGLQRHVLAQPHHGRSRHPHHGHPTATKDEGRSDGTFLPLSG